MVARQLAQCRISGFPLLAATKHQSGTEPSNQVERRLPAHSGAVRDVNAQAPACDVGAFFMRSPTGPYMPIAYDDRVTSHLTGVQHVQQPDSTANGNHHAVRRATLRENAKQPR